jgi:hypothetical protein
MAHAFHAMDLAAVARGERDRDPISLDLDAIDDCEMCQGVGRVVELEGDYVPAGRVADGGGVTRRTGIPCPCCAEQEEAARAAACGSGK